MTLRISSSNEPFSNEKTLEIRELLHGSFEGDFSEQDWQHTLGEYRFLGHIDDELIAHGAVVPRKLIIDGEITTAGYVEAIAVKQTFWRNGHGTALMRAITEHCLSAFSISMLSTDEKAFYRRLGWSEFTGESYVLMDGREVRSAEEDDGLMFLPGLATTKKAINRVVCELREGDAW